MKNLLFAAFLLFFVFGNFNTYAQQKGSFLVIIDKEPATVQELEGVAPRIKEIRYLSSVEAEKLYGEAGKGGAFLVETKKEEHEPVVMLDGKRVPADSLHETSFEKIDVLRGTQALNMYGPVAKDGVWLVKSGTEKDSLKENVFLEVKNKKGKGVEGVAVKDNNGKVLATTNKCGIAVLENFSSGESVTLSKKNLKKKFKVDQPVVSIILGK